MKKVGGGIIGLATARELLRRFPTMTVAVLEKEREVAAHQTGHNSGVIHAGIYYKPGSRMAYTCVRGADLMYQYCAEHDLPIERCGKLIVAVNEKEHEQVERLYKVASQNGVKDLQVLNSEEVNDVGHYQEHSLSFCVGSGKVYKTLSSDSSSGAQYRCLFRIVFTSHRRHGLWFSRPMHCKRDCAIWVNLCRWVSYPDVIH